MASTPHGDHGYAPTALPVMWEEWVRRVTTPRCRSKRRNAGGPDQVINADTHTARPVFVVAGLRTLAVEA